MERMFEDDHPDLAHQLERINQLQLYVQWMIARWYEAVWGSVPGDWEADV